MTREVASSEEVFESFWKLKMVHGKTTYRWHTDDIRTHTSDMWITYEYIRVTYGWHTSTYDWHTDDIQVNTSDIRMTYEWHTDEIQLHTSDIRMTWVHTSDIRITYEYIRVTYGWHTSTFCFGLFIKIKKGSWISFWCTFSAWGFHTNAPYLTLGRRMSHIYGHAISECHKYVVWDNQS